MKRKSRTQQDIRKRSKIIIIEMELKALNNLLKQPLIKQRTPEWYKLRENRLTASDLGDAIKNPLSLAKKKLKGSTFISAGIPALKWGTMFEPMATRCYSQERNNITVYDFGLILDKYLDHFGASPDGINEMGIMIEIKCPYSREIVDNTIPFKYYLQIQGQLAVCQLEECDYIECDFMTYQNPYEYVDDICNAFNDMQTMHGIIAEYKNVDTEEYEYLYSKENLTASQVLDDINKQMELFKKERVIFIKLTPWRLKNINVQRVSFDIELWKRTTPKIIQFWDKVEECKLLPNEEVVVKKQKLQFIEDD